MVDIKFWIRVIRFILDIIEQGLPKEVAISKAAATFNVSEKAIRNMMDK